MCEFISDSAINSIRKRKDTANTREVLEIHSEDRKQQTVGDIRNDHNDDCTDDGRCYRLRHQHHTEKTDVDELEDT